MNAAQRREALQNLTVEELKKLRPDLYQKLIGGGEKVREGTSKRREIRRLQESGRVASRTARGRRIAALGDRPFFELFESFRALGLDDLEALAAIAGRDCAARPLPACERVVSVGAGAGCAKDAGGESGLRE